MKNEMIIFLQIWHDWLCFAKYEASVPVKCNRRKCSINVTHVETPEFD